MTTGCYDASFLLFANAWGAGTVFTAKCPPRPGFIVDQIPGICSGGGMLVAGIDSHIKFDFI